MAYFTKRMISFTEKTAGFSRDGKPLLLALTVEKIGAEITVTLLSPNLAPLKEGEYLLSFAGTECEVMRLTDAASLCATLSNRLGVERGVCALLLFAREGKLVPVAFGKSGKTTFSLEELQAEAARFLRSAASAKKEQKDGRKPFPSGEEKDPPFTAKSPTKEAFLHENDDTVRPYADDAMRPYADGAVRPYTDDTVRPYADDALASDNYFEWEKEDEKQQMLAAPHDNPAHGDCEKQKEKEAVFSRQAHENDFACGKDEPRETTRGQRLEESYFARVKPRLFAFFSDHEEEPSLTNAFPGSFFVRAPFEEGEIVVGVLTVRKQVTQAALPSLKEQELLALCFGVPQGESAPPQPLRSICTFLPVSGARHSGYWMLFQNPRTGKIEPYPFS